MRDIVTDEYERSWRRLRAVAAHYVGDEADDVVQEAFLRAWRSDAGFRGDAAPSTWLHRIVVNAAIDHRRRRQRRTQASLPAHRHMRVRVTVEDGLALRTALARLALQHSRTLVMYEVLGHTHREIAGRLGIPVSTSKRWLAEARRRVRRTLRATARPPERDKDSLRPSGG